MSRMSGKKDGKEGKKQPKKQKAALDKNIRYVGCIGSEAPMSSDKEYGGGSSGAILEVAVSFARDKSKKYVALARVGTDGHSFAFDDLQNADMIDDEGCRLSCMGEHSDQACGCADAACGELDAVLGEEHVRRWAVYEVGEAPKKSTKAKGKKKKKTEL
jgi:hypothetical protein